MGIVEAKQSSGSTWVPQEASREAEGSRSNQAKGLLKNIGVFRECFCLQDLLLVLCRRSLLYSDWIYCNIVIYMCK